MTDDSVSTLTVGDEQYGAELNPSVWESQVSGVAERDKKAAPLMTFEAVITMTPTKRDSPGTFKWLTGSS